MGLKLFSDTKGGHGHIIWIIYDGKPHLITKLGSLKREFGIHLHLGPHNSESSPN